MSLVGSLRGVPGSPEPCNSNSNSNKLRVLVPIQVTVALAGCCVMLAAHFWQALAGALT